MIILLMNLTKGSLASCTGCPGKSESIKSSRQKDKKVYQRFGLRPLKVGKVHPSSPANVARPALPALQDMLMVPDPGTPRTQNCSSLRFTSPLKKFVSPGHLNFKSQTKSQCQKLREFFAIIVRQLLFSDIYKNFVLIQNWTIFNKRLSK